MSKNHKVDERKALVADLFALLKVQGRKRTWLADQLKVSKQRLSQYEHGVSTMPQNLYDHACTLLQAPPTICRQQMPSPRRNTHKK